MNPESAESVMVKFPVNFKLRAAVVIKSRMIVVIEDFTAQILLFLTI